MSAHKKCAHCGHQNLERAVICFQCGKPLVEETASADESSAPRRSQRVVQAMWQKNLPDTAHDPKQLPGTGFLNAVHSEEPLTCLVCGTLNEPNAETCVKCGTPLIVPDRDAHLVASASARTDVGQVRENNEDSVGLWAFKGALLALVADGMGGAVAGEEASRLTVEAVQADFVGIDGVEADLLTLAEELIMEKLTAAIQAANLAVIDRVDEDAALRGMGTTATLAFIRGRRAMFAHVGDSRAYLVDGVEGWINQITSDHSFVEALLEAGHISEDQAREHPMKNVLYRALGQAPDTTADLYDRYLKGQDRIVLCSDGLARHVAPDEIAQVVLLESDPHAATKRLIDLANERGGEDNVSAIVILMQEVPGTGQLSGYMVEQDPDETLPFAPRNWKLSSMVPPAMPAESDDEPTFAVEQADTPEDTLVEAREHEQGSGSGRTVTDVSANRDQQFDEYDADDEDTIPTRRTLEMKTLAEDDSDDVEAAVAAELFSGRNGEDASGYLMPDEDTVETIPPRDAPGLDREPDAGDVSLDDAGDWPDDDDR